MQNQKLEDLKLKIDKKDKETKKRLRKQSKAVKKDILTQKENLYKKILRAKIIKIIKERLPKNWSKYAKKAERLHLLLEEVNFTERDILIECLNDEELNADIDLLRKYFKSELNVFDDWDEESKNNGIRDKFMSKQTEFKIKQIK